MCFCVKFLFLIAWFVGVKYRTGVKVPFWFWGLGSSYSTNIEIRNHESTVICTDYHFNSSPVFREELREELKDE